MIGLGRMGANMAKRLVNGGHTVVGYDRDPKAATELAKEDGIESASSLEDLVKQLKSPRAIWVMVPAGGPTEETVKALGELASKDDVIIDGGNSYFKDDVRRAEELKEKGIHYCDAGTSGGLWGLERGYCLMVGCDKGVFQRLEPIFKTLAPGKGSIELTPGRKGDAMAEAGYLYCGKSGSGHFVKMVHNGIEYGMMQSMAEGFEIMEKANSEALPENLRFDLNLADIAEVWRRGSVISSWLLDLGAIALTKHPDLSNYSGFVQDSGEGRWTVQAAIDEAVPATVLTASLYARFRSREETSFADQMLSALRFQFGGHVEKTAPDLIKSDDHEGAGHVSEKKHA
jgi:6-phosphogluconate dehydrogenase